MRLNQIFTLFLALLTAAGSYAQGLSLQVSGTLTDGSGTPIGGSLVEFTAYSGGWQVIDTMSTLPNGTYSFTATTPPAVTSGIINVMAACGNNFLVDTLVFSATNTSFVSNFTCGSAPNCDATFGHSPTMSNVLDQYFFYTGQTDTSTIVSYDWDFNDGNTVTTTSGNVQHTFAAPGFYNVCLTITTAAGCVTTFCSPLNLAPPSNCVASFSSFPSGNGFVFNADTTQNSPSTHYDFVVNGTLYPGPVTGIVPVVNGANFICLVVADSGSCVDSLCQTIFVNSNPACDADFWAAIQGPGQFSFTNQSSPITANTSFAWHFGDGNSSTQVSPTHTYSASGTYQVVLVMDNGSCVDSILSTLNVLLACEAGFNAYPDSTSNAVNFVPLSQGFNPGVTFDWDFGDGNTGSGFNQNHTYANPGVYQVCLTVTDSIEGCSDTHCDSVVVGPQSACDASFTYAGNYFFYDGNTDTTQILSYLWYFGDGNVDTTTLSNVAHTYATNGIYPACLEIVTTSGCVAFTCDDVIIGPPPLPCDASFSIIPDTTSGNANSYFFDPVSSNSALLYSWDFGDNSVGSSPLPLHVYQNPGTYLVCLTVTDSANGCSDTFCDTLVVGSNPPCQANFTAGTTPTGNVQFVSQAAGSNLGYAWDFGDGNTATGPNPVHTYANFGTYVACLTVTDSINGCTSTACDTVVVAPPPGLQVSGQVMAGNQPAENALVYLIQADSLGTILTAIDSTVTDSMGFYTFYGQNPGDYLVKAALQPNDPDYANYLPTYLGDELFWNLAVSTVLTQVSVFNPPISLVAGNNPGGPAFVGGLVSQGANKVEGEGLENVSVYLMDTQGNAVAYTLTDEDGAYQFDNIAYGDYMLYVEMMGLYSYPWEVSLTAANPSFDVADFVANDTEVRPAGTTSLDDLAAELRVFPNPARDFLTIETGSTPAASWDISLLNVVGQVMTGDRLETHGNRLRLDLHGLPNGIYLLRLQNGEQQLTRRFQKVR
jgi:PKD repeat protein